MTNAEMIAEIERLTRGVSHIEQYCEELLAGSVPRPPDPLPIPPNPPIPTPLPPVEQSLKGLQIFPRDNPWNQRVSGLTVDPNSAKLIASIGGAAGLHPNFGTTWQGEPNGMPINVVGGSQPELQIQFVAYPLESDQVGYPIPANALIEAGSDRHLIVVDRDNMILYELFNARREGNALLADSGAHWNLKNNDLRPAGWTSADAAGLPILPGLVRYEEVAAGGIPHALRFTAVKTRRAYTPPARHFASPHTSVDLPPMGMRVRLKSGFDLTKYPSPARIILQCLKDFGMILADNGSNWFISGEPNPKWDDESLAWIKRVKGSDLEVCKMGTIATS